MYGLCHPLTSVRITYNLFPVSLLQSPTVFLPFFLFFNLFPFLSFHLSVPLLPFPPSHSPSPGPVSPRGLPFPRLSVTPYNLLVSPPTLLVSEAFLFNWLCFSAGLSASPLPGFLLRSLSLFASQMPPSETVLPPRVSKRWPSTRKATKKAASCFLDTESKRVIQALEQPKNGIFNQSCCSSKKKSPGW